MEEYESLYENLLHIRTTGRDASHSDQFIFPYEATEYSVLERVAQTGLIRKGNTLLDYGCGKGRVDFFLTWQTRCHALGVEIEPRLYESALANKETAVSGSRTSFVLGSAADLVVPPEVDRCFFFNPFSETILLQVLTRLRESLYRKPREILLFFYYPSDEYLPVLMTDEDLTFYDEIDCGDLFAKEDPRERVLIFQMGMAER